MDMRDLCRGVLRQNIGGQTCRLLLAASRENDAAAERGEHRSGRDADARGRPGDDERGGSERRAAFRIGRDHVSAARPRRERRGQRGRRRHGTM
eukprot:875475-Prymnesium_polylepis.1